MSDPISGHTDAATSPAWRTRKSAATGHSSPIREPNHSVSPAGKCPFARFWARAMNRDSSDPSEKDGPLNAQTRTAAAATRIPARASHGDPRARLMPCVPGG